MFLRACAIGALAAALAALFIPQPRAAVVALAALGVSKLLDVPLDWVTARYERTGLRIRRRWYGPGQLVRVACGNGVAVDWTDHGDDIWVLTRTWPDGADHNTPATVAYRRLEEIAPRYELAIPYGNEQR
jgi:hypothetical protein